MSTVLRTLQNKELSRYLSEQLNNFFPDGNTISADVIDSFLPEVLDRVHRCFSKINNKYFFNGKEAVFNHLHGDQYSMFLYLASNTAYKMGFGENIAEKIFLLNKALYGIDAFYEVDLPEVFLFVHPLGTVLGRAHYQNYFMVYQGCGVGSNHDIYPELGEFVSLRPGSKVLGNCRVQRNCTIAADSLLLDRDLESNCLYIGNPKSFITKKSESILPIWRI